MQFQRVGRLARVVGLIAVATTLQAGSLLAQDIKAVPRERTMIHVGWSAGAPTLTAPQNANWFALGADTRNGQMYQFEPLFFYNMFKGEHIPWLAESFAYNSDFTSITVNIRNGVTWSDGEPFTANDVAFTLNMLVENGKGKKDLRKAVEIAEQVKQAVVEDKLKVRIDLNRADPRFVYRQLTNYFGHGLYWVPEHIWKTIDDKAAFTFYDPAKGWPVGTGAWKVVRATPQQMILDRRDDWWAAKTGFRPLPQVERIITVPSPNADRDVQLLANNEVDAASAFPTPQLVKSLLEKNPKLTTFTGNKPPYGNLDWWPHSLYFNHLAPDSPFADVKVRQAVRYAINRQQIVDVVFEGANQPVVQPYPSYAPLQPYIKALDPVIKKYHADEFNPRETERLMKEAGYAKDGEGMWVKDGKRVGGPIESHPVLTATTQAVVQQLRRAGFDARFSATPDSFRKFRSGETLWHVFGHNGGSIFDPIDTLRMYQTKNRAPIGQITFFVARWSNPEFDGITDKMEKLPVGDAQLQPMLVQAMDIWMREAVEVPLENAYHWYPMNTTYWTNWPTEENPYINPCQQCFDTSSVLIAHNLKPVK